MLKIIRDTLLHAVALIAITAISLTIAAIIAILFIAWTWKALLAIVVVFLAWGLIDRRDGI